MESHLTYEQALAALAWQIELGADDAILDAPVDRYALGAADKAARAAQEAQGPAQGGPQSGANSGPDTRGPRAARPAVPPPPPKRDFVAEAAEAARTAADLPALAAAMAAIETPLAQGARNFLFAAGDPAAPVMIIGEAPSRFEDNSGQAYDPAGLEGALLDRMLAAIDRSRAPADPARGAYLTYALPWRLPANRLPDPAELDLIRPFLLRHIALAAPKAILLQGNLACLALLGRGGLTRLRGSWAEVAGVPALPSPSLAQLLAAPAAKRDAWADLLALRARVD